MNAPYFCHKVYEKIKWKRCKGRRTREERVRSKDLQNGRGGREIIRGKNRGGGRGGRGGESRDTVAPVQVTVAPFCIFPTRHRGHDFDPLPPYGPPCSSSFFCSLSAIVPVRLRSPFLYVHVCYIHLGSLPAVKSDTRPRIYIPSRVALDRTYLPRVQGRANITVPRVGGIDFS